MSFCIKIKKKAKISLLSVDCVKTKATLLFTLETTIHLIYLTSLDSMDNKCSNISETPSSKPSNCPKFDSNILLSVMDDMMTMTMMII